MTEFLVFFNVVVIAWNVALGVLRFGEKDYKRASMNFSGAVALFFPTMLLILRLAK